jgi:hypothetical protein
MTEPNPPRILSPSRREFLKTSTAATVGLGMLGNAHAAGSDSIKVGLVGCGGRGTGAAENICEAAPTSSRTISKTAAIASEITRFARRSSMWPTSDRLSALTVTRR